MKILTRIVSSPVWLFVVHTSFLLDFRKTGATVHRPALSWYKGNLTFLTATANNLADRMIRTKQPNEIVPYGWLQLHHAYEAIPEIWGLGGWSVEQDPRTASVAKMSENSERAVA